jgi:hypothetical protein
MNESLNKILNRLENYSKLNPKERDLLDNDLIEFSSEYPDKFIESIRDIVPSEESVLFEVYEILSTQPKKWVDFIITEFDRIEKFTKESKNKMKDSVSSPLEAISFFARHDFSGNEKLITRIKNGTFSDSIQIIKSSMDLLTDIYLIDKSKYNSCRQVIQRLTDSKTIEISRLAKEILTDLDNPVKPKSKLRFYSIYSFLIFIGGLISSVISIDFYNETFMSFFVIATIFLISGLIAWMLHQNLTKNRTVKISETLSIGFGYGFIICFLFLFINMQSSNTNLRQENYEITNHGTLAKGEYSSCNQPYVKFQRNGVIKKMTFNCNKQKLVENSKQIILTIKEGFFGIDIVINKRLKTTGANKL